jgi:uncharacterized membrane protein
MFAAGAVAALIVGLSGAWPYAPLAGWDTAALVFSVSVWIAVIGRMSSAQTAAHATREDPGKAATDVIVPTAAVASLAAVGFLLVRATSSKGSTQDLLAGAGVASVALSWFAVHTLFTLRYARLYYSDTDLEKPAIRATALRHALLSYLFGAVILATTINLIAGLGTSSGGG